MLIWTETPLAQMWQQLRYLGNPSNVYRLLSGKIKSNRDKIWPESEELEQRAYDISACMRQADEYYRASETVGLTTNPLLQFYGAQALAKGVILSDDSTKRLSDLNYHGLNTRLKTAAKQEDAERLGTYLDDPSLWTLEKEFAITHDGVFPLLCRAIGDSIPEKGQLLTLKDLLRVIPDLSSIYYRHYGEPSHCFYLYRKCKMIPDVRMEVFFSKRNEYLYAVREVFPEFKSGFEETEESNSGLKFRSVEAIKEIPSFCAIEKGTVAGEYLIRPLASGIYRSFSVLYASLFIMSIAVRYKPAFWTHLVEGDKSGSASIAEALCNVAKRRLPNDALEQIHQEEFKYATPGYYV